MDGATQIPILECEARRWHNSRVCALSRLYILKLPTGQILHLGNKEELGELSPCSKPAKQWEFRDFGSGPSPKSD